MFLHSLLDVPVARLPVVRGLMQEQEINVVCIQTAQGVVHGGLALIHGRPQLGDQEDVLPLHAAGFDGAARGLLVHVGVGGADQADSVPQGALDGGLGFRRGEGEYADTSHGHPGSVVQVEVFHGAPPYHRRAVFIAYTDILYDETDFVHYTVPISV